MTAIEPIIESQQNIDRIEEIARYNIRRFMTIAGKSQSDLAPIWGVTRGAVSQRLNGYSQLKFTEVVLAAKWLGVTVDDLMDDSALIQDEELRSKMHLTGENKKTAGITPTASDGLPRLGLNQRHSD